MSEARNNYTPEEAAEKLCPDRFTLPSPNCLATGCMYWLWGWSAADGFETVCEESLDWGEMAHEADALEQFLATVLPADQAHALAAAWVDAPEDDYEVQDRLSDEINSALENAYAESPADGSPTRLELFAAARLPEGDGWGSEGARAEDGKMVIEFRRPMKRRGFCGKLAAVYGA